MIFDEDKRRAMEYLMKDVTKKDYIMKITVPVEKMMELAYDIMYNYPEASCCLKCTEWKYTKGQFEFYDEDEDKTYKVTTKEIAEKGLPIFIEGLLNNKWHFDGMAKSDVLDPCNYDAYASDAVVQCVIFGDVIYG